VAQRSVHAAISTARARFDHFCVERIAPLREPAVDIVLRDCG
jgi:hypothetical protein